MEDRTSSLDIPVHRALQHHQCVRIWPRGGCCGFLVTGANWMAAFGVLWRLAQQLRTAGFTNSDAMTSSYSGRFTWAPIFESSPDGYSLVHLGVSGRYRYAGDDGPISASARVRSSVAARVRSTSGRAPPCWAKATAASASKQRCSTTPLAPPPNIRRSTAKPLAAPASASPAITSTCSGRRPAKRGRIAATKVRSVP